MADIEAILAAEGGFEGHAIVTPLVHVPQLDARLGGTVLLKLETMQRTGSFKFRGAWNAYRTRRKQRPIRHLAASSSGNHAQGVAEVARLAGIPATLIMPDDAPAEKKQRVMAAGGRVISYCRETQDRDEVAAALAEDCGAEFIHPFNDGDVIAGQGTVGVEIAKQAQAIGVVPDAVLCPVGGGGLISGVALAVRHRFPDCAITGVEPEGFDDHKRSLATGKIATNIRRSGSICDALLAPAPGKCGLAVAAHLLAPGLSVSDGETMAAVAYAFHRLRLVVEPGGAVALAALLQGRIPVSGRVIVVILSGGNISGDLLATASASSSLL